jgi:hypothetical protein
MVYTDSTDAANGNSRKVDIRLSGAYRPWDSRWMWLDRLDLIDEETNGSSAQSHARKVVNHLNANYQPNRQSQISIMYGAKYIQDYYDGTTYNGFTDVVSVEARHDINQDWDIGANAGMLHSWNGGEFSYNAGASLGYKLTDNTWVAAGYNFLGFSDNDFSGANYLAKGPYVTVRVKFDQDSLKLNKPMTARLPSTGNGSEAPDAAAKSPVLVRE